MKPYCFLMLDSLCRSLTSDGAFRLDVFRRIPRLQVHVRTLTRNIPFAGSMGPIEARSHVPKHLLCWFRLWKWQVKVFQTWPELGAWKAVEDGVTKVTPQKKEKKTHHQSSVKKNGFQKKRFPEMIGKQKAPKKLPQQRGSTAGGKNHPQKKEGKANDFLMQKN